MQRPTLGFHLVDDCIDHQILRLLGEMQKSLYCLPNLMGQLDEVKCKLVPGIAFGFVFLADFGAVCVCLCLHVANSPALHQVIQCLPMWVSVGVQERY